ncbi:hypothetical protein, partial [Brevibacterium samyangense]
VRNRADRRDRADGRDRRKRRGPAMNAAQRRNSDRLLGWLTTAVVGVFVLVLVGMGLVRLAGQDSARPDVARGPAVFVGVSGLTFEDIDPDRMPHLWSLVADGSIGTATPRSVRSTSCPIDGWLAVGSGRRAADAEASYCREPESPAGNEVPDWDVYLERVEADNYDAQLGALAEAVPSVAAIGPGAAIAAADEEGRVDTWSSIDEDLSDQVSTVLGDGHEVLLVDLGNTERSGYSLLQLDERIGQIREATDAAGAELLVSSIADGRTDTSSMQFTAAVGGQFGRGILTSESTRQPGLVQTTDILPTLLQQADVPDDPNLAGAVMVSEPGGTTAARYQQMLDRQVAVSTQAALAAWFYPIIGVLLMGLLGVAWTVVRVERRAGRDGVSAIRRSLRTVGLFFAATPVATFLVNLVPWERSTSPDVAMLAALAGFALLIALGGLLGPWRRHPLGPFGFVSVVTVLTLTVDVLTGSRLQMSTLLGEPLLIASRFYGIGNSALALYCTALVMVLVTVCAFVRGTDARARTLRVGFVVAALVLSCVLLATPGLGTKFGSVPTLISGLAVFALAVAGIRATVRNVLLIAGSAGAVMLVALVGDWLRPADQRTHFGRFFDSVLSGEAGAILLRKIDMNIGILTQSWATVLLPLVIALVFWVLLRPSRFGVPGLPRLYAQYPLVRAGLVALLVLLTVGTIINDSGIVVPAVGILYAVPLFAHLAGQNTPR